MRAILLSFLFFSINTQLIKSQPSTCDTHFESLFKSKSTTCVPYRVPPVIGAWFWGKEQFEPDGYKHFIDQAASHSCYNLLATAIRVAGRDITDIDVHNQVKLATIYALEKGLKMAVDLDPRLACQKFAAMYPNELQASLWLKESVLSEHAPIQVIVKSVRLSDHMTGGKTPYSPIASSLLRVYSYYKTKGGIHPESLRDITDACKVISSSSDSIIVQLPQNSQDRQIQACVMASFSYLVPDIFAPHLMEFTRSIINSYSDIPLAGGMRDEWGFPPSLPVDKMILEKHFWYSTYYANTYKRKTNGRELLHDCLLMAFRFKGKEKEKNLAINHYMELNREQNKILEDDFYQAIKEVFGQDAAVITHPTWYPYPNQLESKKNGLYWWVAKRDWAQTDEVTPLAIRTALTKKWNSPIWYNQYYSSEKSDYEKEIWRYALAGGRVNYHPLYPSKQNRDDRHTQLLDRKLTNVESKIRLLNFISQSPMDCPVAIIFGHTAAINQASPSFEDVGMELANKLWERGIATDLIPTSEIKYGSLSVDEKGLISYGPQKYTAVVLYNPEFEEAVTAEFFTRASHGATTLFCVGNWTMDFNGCPIDGNQILPAKMIHIKELNTTVSKIAKELKIRNTELQTPATQKLEGFGYTSNTMPLKGHVHLIDGTVIQISGKENPEGDQILSTIKIGEYTVKFDAIGVAAIRLNDQGEVEALAAGGLKSVRTPDLEIKLKKRTDFALWKNNNGEYEGVIQSLEKEIPESLLSLTKKWIIIKSPITQ